MTDKYGINWEEVTSIDFGEGGIRSLIHRQVTIKLKDGSSKSFSPKTFYEIPPYPIEEALGVYNIKSNGAPDLGGRRESKKEHKRITSIYTDGNIPIIRENNKFYIPKPESTWSEDQQEKQNNLWGEFYVHVKLEWDKTKPKRIKNYLNKISKNEKSIKLRQQRIQTELKYNERYREIIKQIIEE